jgi:hypothetical protein
MKKASSTSTQANRDLDEILEKRDVTHEAGDRIEQRAARVHADLGDPPGAKKVRLGETGS